MRTRALLFLAALAALSSGCQTVQTTQAGAVGVDRQQQMMVSSASVNQSAARAYVQTVGSASQKGQLNRDANEVNRVRAIARRLIPETRVFRADAPGWAWEVNVISSNEVNAWCMPGGKIAVYSGLIQRLQATDDEIAAVMGHEIAHALREHGRERASQAAGQGLAIGVLSAVTGAPAGAGDLTQLILQYTFNLPNSRTHETEADRIGIELAARAGYDPRAAISLWQKMQRLGGGGTPQFMSTHPSHETRIADLQNYSVRVMPLYQAARR